MDNWVLTRFRTPFAEIIFLLLTCLSTARCTHKEVKADDPDALYNEAEDAYKDERYQTAIEKYRDVKNRFPYSTRAVDSELRIADAYFDQESYLEAESSYDLSRLHPSHPKIDYVQYRIAMSYYYQIPDEPQRDLNAAYKAIEAFDTLLTKYPGSEYTAKAKDYQAEARKKLAEYENYVADFYYRREHFLSASYRYASLLTEFPKLGYDEVALFRLGDCYYRIKMFENARATLNQLLTQYPESTYKTSTQALLEKVDKAVTEPKKD